MEALKNSGHAEDNAAQELAEVTSNVRTISNREKRETSAAETQVPSDAQGELTLEAIEYPEQETASENTPDEKPLLSEKPPLPLDESETTIHDDSAHPAQPTPSLNAETATSDAPVRTQSDMTETKNAPSTAVEPPVSEAIESESTDTDSTWPPQKNLAPPPKATALRSRLLWPLSVSALASFIVGAGYYYFNATMDRLDAELAMADPIYSVLLPEPVVDSSSVQIIHTALSATAPAETGTTAPESTPPQSAEPKPKPVAEPLPQRPAPAPAPEIRAMP